MRRMLLHPTSELPDDTPVEQNSTSLDYKAHTQRCRANNRRQRAGGSKRNAAKVKIGARCGRSHPLNARLNETLRAFRRLVELGLKGKGK